LPSPARLAAPLQLASAPRRHRRRGTNESTSTAVKKQRLDASQLGRRIRDVRQGFDGWIYLLTDDGGGKDALLRLYR